MIYLFIFILGFLSAWEEIQQLVQRGSWRRIDYRYPEWKTDHNSWKKNFDSHHIAFGLLVLVFFITVSLVSMAWYFIPVCWGGMFWVRNIFLHIIFKRKPSWKYLLPLL